MSWKDKEARKAYSNKPEVKEHYNAYRRKRWSERPDVRERQKVKAKEWLAKPEIKARRNEYARQPETRARRREYEREQRKRPEVAERIRKNTRKWRINNLRRRLEYQREYLKRPEVRQRRKEKWKENREERIMTVLGNHIRRVCKFGIKKSRRTMEIVGCSIGFFLNHIEEQFTEGMTWDNYGTEWHIDHIVPVAWFKGLLHEVEWQRVVCHWTNLQPLWAEENRKKSDKYISMEELAERIEKERKHVDAE